MVCLICQLFLCADFGFVGVVTYLPEDGPLGVDGFMGFFYDVLLGLCPCFECVFVFVGWGGDCWFGVFVRDGS